MIYGLDLLGLAKYGHNVAKDNFPSGWALGAFAQQFGDAKPAIKQLLSSGKVAGLRVHIKWSDSHSYDDTHMNDVLAEAKHFDDMAQQYRGIPIEVSPFCEHHIAQPDVFLDRTQKAAPHCIIVNTPDHYNKSGPKGGFSANYKNEVHGSGATPPPSAHGYNFSFDGNSCFDSDVASLKESLSGAEVFYLWAPNFNGVTGLETTRTPISDRTHWPDRDYFASVVRQIGFKGHPSLPVNWVYRVYDPKKHKPVMIAPIKIDSLEFRFKEIVVDTLSLIGPAKRAGSYMYVSRLSGRQMGQQYGICEVWANGTNQGTINPEFSEGFSKVIQYS